MNYPIICFEGPSGVGKTTLCNLLSEDYNIVPEVNLLFERPENEPAFWYHERQVDRYKLCEKSDKVSILDGDVFQPIWYNWVCDYPSIFLSKEETHKFYKKRLLEGQIRFPDLYIIFHVEEEQLWIRKERDKTRQRRNFEKHLSIIEPLKEYYRFLDQDTDLEMLFIHYADLEKTRKKVLSAIKNVQKKDIDALSIFRQIEEWIQTKKRWH